MLSNISWGSYSLTLIVITFIYYVYILQRHYRSQLYKVIGYRSRPVAEESFDNKLIPLANLFKDELKAYLEQAAILHIDKVSILNALSSIAGKYAPLKDTPYQANLSRRIQYECETQCAIHLNEQELLQVWMSK